MDLTQPVHTVVPSVRGRVLSVLARTTSPLSGRRIAELADTPHVQVATVLGELADSGLVNRERVATAFQFTLNREHVAAEAVVALVRQRELLFERIASSVKGWKLRPTAVWVFGSAARADGGVDSDIDLLVVRPDRIEATQSVWRAHVEELTHAVKRWSGNDGRVLELSAAELAVLASKGDRLVSNLRRDALVLAGSSKEQLLPGRRP